MDFHPIPALRIVLLGVLLTPLAAALVCAFAGTRGANPRRFAMWFALLHLGLTLILLGGAATELTHRGDPSGRGTSQFRAEEAFRPIAVPGDVGATNDPDSQNYETTWSVLSLGPRPVPTSDPVPPPDIQFYLGVDGLNIWLVALTSLMTVIAVLLSLDNVKERPGGYYAALFVLETGVLGAFLAFDVILFYVFFELTLIPSFFLIGLWGVGSSRREAARKFFLYTLLGGLLTLTGLVGIVLTNPTPVHPNSPDRVAYILPVTPEGERLVPREGPITFSIPTLMRNVETWALARWYKSEEAARRLSAATQRLEAARVQAKTPDEPGVQQALADVAAAEQAREDTRAIWERYQLIQAWLFIALVAGFAVKVPILPFHTWLPAAYAEAPAPVTMLLSALLAKLGTYGILRIVLPFAPDAALAYGLPVIGTLGAIGIVYAALCAYAQRDIKLLTAYSSVSHLGFLVIALFSFNVEGLAGATLHMLNHGLATGAMFGLLVFLTARYRTLDMNQYSGLWAKFPGYTFLVFVIALASIGLPGLNNFVSEMLMLAGLFDPSVSRQWGYGLAAVAALGILLSAWYTLTMLRRVFFGPLQEPPTAGGPVPGLTGRETFAFAVPAGLCVLLGVVPQPVLDTIKADVGVVALFGDHARMRAGTFVSRPLPPPPVGAVLGGPGVAEPMGAPGMGGAPGPRMGGPGGGMPKQAPPPEMGPPGGGFPRPPVGGFPKGKAAPPRPDSSLN